MYHTKGHDIIFLQVMCLFYDFSLEVETAFLLLQSFQLMFDH